MPQESKSPSAGLVTHINTWLVPFLPQQAVSQPATPTSFLIIRFSKKCGISIPIDGFEDEEINIEGLENYAVGESDDEATDDETDPFEEVEEDRGLTVAPT